MVSAAYPVAFYVFFFSFTFFILTQSHENSSLNTDGLNCRLQVSAGQCRSVQVSAGQCRSVQVSAGQCRSVQVSAGQCRTVQVSAGQCRLMQVKLHVVLP